MARGCGGVDANVLTSSGCPARCGASPCVLYKPTSDDRYKCHETIQAGPCFVDTRTTDMANAPCDLTYQCLDTLVDDAVEMWSVALTPAAKQELGNTTLAPVTTIQKLQYPKNGVATARFQADATSGARGTAVDITMDDGSVLATPTSVVNFFVHGINIEKAVTAVDYSKRRWMAVGFDNCNLHKIPAGFSQLHLQYLSLSRNFIAKITDATPLQQVTILYLDQNDLTDLSVSLPSIVTLNLSGNPLTKIPDSVFSMKMLHTLSMRRGNYSGLNVTAEQYVFLAERHVLELDDIAATACGEGFTRRTLPNSNTSVCVSGLPSASTPLPVVSEAAVGPRENVSISMAVVGLIVSALVVMALGAFVLRYRRHRRGAADMNDDATCTTTDSTDLLLSDRHLLAGCIEYDAVECLEKLQSSESIGISEVWRGLCMGQDVAVERLRSDQHTHENAIALAATASIVARLEHEKIVRFVGVAWTRELVSIEIVTEWMEGGTLASLLSSPQASSLTWTFPKLQIAIDVAEALVYLHSFNPKLLHRDLTSRHVFLTRNMDAKLGGFRSARVDASDEETMTKGVGTGQWIAPEVLLGQRYTESVDVYAFGALLSELDTAKTPIADETTKDASAFPQRATSGQLQPSFTSACPRSILALAQECVALDPLERPTALAVAYRLRQIRKHEFQ